VVAIARQVLDPDVSAGEGLAKLGFEVLLGHGHGNISWGERAPHHGM
jgi:hypothetical protein